MQSTISNRNFSLFIKVKLDVFNRNLDFDAILNEVKPQFNEQLNKEFFLLALRKLFSQTCRLDLKFLLKSKINH